MNGIAEGARLVRGTSVNQVPGLENVVVTRAPAYRRAGWFSASIAERRAARRASQPGHNSELEARDLRRRMKVIRAMRRQR